MIGVSFSSRRAAQKATSLPIIREVFDRHERIAPRIGHPQIPARTPPSVLGCPSPLADAGEERYYYGHIARSDGYEVGKMAKREVAVGDFRQRATELVRHVEETKEVITITRRGVPVAELRAVTVDPEALLGSVTYLDSDLTRPVVGPGDWEAAS
jgi:antitoxin (DNA-binding transcriptional repressor) of toxin-antitoxin stability system